MPAFLRFVSRLFQKNYRLSFASFTVWEILISGSVSASNPILTPIFQKDRIMDQSELDG